MGLEKIDCGAHAFEIHVIHRFVYSSDDGGHISCYLPHRNGGFYSACDGVYAAGESQQVESFRFLPDGIGGVYTGSVVVAFLECLVG
jgi:hypothetical protein